MPAAAADPTTLGYLGRALSLELSAVQLYSTQARLVAAWGLDSAAERLREEAREEMAHADRVIGRMLAMGVAPNASQLRPVRLGSDLADLLRHDLAFEKEIEGLYFDASRHCGASGDAVGRVFFEQLLEEERAHGRALGTWVAELEGNAGAELRVNRSVGGDTDHE